MASNYFNPQDELSYDLGKISKNEMLRMLESAPDGTFLVRDSSSVDGKTVSVHSEKFGLAQFQIQKLNVKTRSGVCYGVKHGGEVKTFFSSIPEFLSSLKDQCISKDIKLTRGAFYHKKVEALVDSSEKEGVNNIKFVKGEILTVTANIDGWFAVKNNANQVGLVQPDLVRRLTISEYEKLEQVKRDSGVSFLSNESESNGFEAEAFRDYFPNIFENNHLIVKKGQKVFVERVTDDGKCFGRIGNKSGFFPYNVILELKN